MYLNMIPRVPRPRGLGGLGHHFAGLGTWVVDKPWGLSPAIIPGQPRPYQDMVRTQLPRSQHPRLLNLHMGPVLAAGTYPQLIPANTPVFRTPVRAPGVEVVSDQLPRTPALNGFGWVPMGVAHPPFRLAMNGFGQTTGAPETVTVTVAGRPYTATVSSADAAALKAIAVGAAKVYGTLKAQRDTYETIERVGREAWQASGLSEQQAAINAMADAQSAVYGSAQAQNAAMLDLERWESVLASLQEALASGQFGDVPPEMAGVMRVLTTRTTRFDVSGDTSALGHGPPPLNLGFVFMTALAVIAIAAAAGAVGFAYYTGKFDVAKVQAEVAKKEAETAAEKTRMASKAWQVADAYRALLTEKIATAPTAEARMEYEAKLKAITTDVKAQQVANQGPAATPEGPPSTWWLWAIGLGVVGYALGIFDRLGGMARGWQRGGDGNGSSRRVVMPG